MKIKILESAKDDLKEGYYFYEFQKEGLGSFFVNSLASDIESLKIYAGIHNLHYGKYYRLLSKRFPFSTYYRIIESEVWIYAIIDSRRDPAWIRDRLQY